MKQNASILVIYTGGTIGMVEDSRTGALHPFDFNHLLQQIPELEKFNYHIEAISFDPLIDSSDMNPSDWVKIACLIEQHYDLFDGFVVLHGSDTMSYTASALSFMLENLSKPVVFTGSQLPIGVIRTDGKENFITAIEIAAAKRNGKPIVPEVTIYFEYQLYRGNRTTKYNAHQFEAFRSVNYPILAKAGVNIDYRTSFIHSSTDQEFRVFKNLDNNIGILKLFPGITEKFVQSVLFASEVKAIVMETFGSGNAPTCKWFIDALKDAIDKDIVILNVTQCMGGSVEMGKYETSRDLSEIGVISGGDMTTEAAVTKLMYLFGNHYPLEKIKKYLQISLRGEMTVN